MAVLRSCQQQRMTQLWICVANCMDFVAAPGLHLVSACLHLVSACLHLVSACLHLQDGVRLTAVRMKGAELVMPVEAGYS
jgi:hypothetical protein